MSEVMFIIKKSKALTEVVKAILGQEVKSAYVGTYWNNNGFYNKKEEIENLRLIFKNTEKLHSSFQRKKDNTGLKLHIDCQCLFIEYKDGRLIFIRGGEWSNIKIISSNEVEVID